EVGGERCSNLAAFRYRQRRRRGRVYRYLQVVATAPPSPIPPLLCDNLVQPELTYTNLEASRLKRHKLPQSKNEVQTFSSVMTYSSQISTSYHHVLICKPHPLAPCLPTPDHHPSRPLFDSS